MSNQTENHLNKDDDDKDYHFSKGKPGRVVRWLVRIGKRPETIDETVTAPVILTLMAFLWADKHPDCGQFPIWVYVASVTTSGTWYGLVRGGPEFVRPLFRGILIGGLTAMALYLCLPHIARPQEWSSIAGNMVMIGMDLFFFTHALSAIGREFLLTTEDQWKKGGVRRQKIFGADSHINILPNTYALLSEYIKYLWDRLYLFWLLVTQSKSLEGRPPSLCALVLLVRTAFLGSVIAYFSAKMSGIQFSLMLSNLVHLLSPHS